MLQCWSVVPGAINLRPQTNSILSLLGKGSNKNLANYQFFFYNRLTPPPLPYRLYTLAKFIIFTSKKISSTFRDPPLPARNHCYQS